MASDELEYVPVSLLARRHLVSQRAMHEELRKAGARMIVIANQPQVHEPDYQAYIRRLHDAAGGAQ